MVPQPSSHGGESRCPEAPEEILERNAATEHDERKRKEKKGGPKAAFLFGQGSGDYLTTSSVWFTNVLTSFIVHASFCVSVSMLPVAPAVNWYVLLAGVFVTRGAAVPQSPATFTTAKLPKSSASTPRV